MERRVYTDVDKAALVAQREEEARVAGKGPFGVQRFQGYRGLAELPWYELDANGSLHLTDDGVPSSIDFHCHLGMSLLLAPKKAQLLQPRRRCSFNSLVV